MPGGIWKISNRSPPGRLQDTESGELASGKNNAFPAQRQLSAASPASPETRLRAPAHVTAGERLRYKGLLPLFSVGRRISRGRAGFHHQITKREN
jgi:hypothetical protein